MGLYGSHRTICRLKLYFILIILLVLIRLYGATLSMHPPHRKSQPPLDTQFTLTTMRELRRQPENLRFSFLCFSASDNKLSKLSRDSLLRINRLYTFTRSTDTTHHSTPQVQVVENYFVINVATDCCTTSFGHMRPQLDT